MGMNHSISYFIGNQMNASEGEVMLYSDFSELAGDFKKCAKGVKHSAYFVRGKLNPVHRKDVNLKQSTMLIIDGDEGVRGKNAPNPKDVHQALKKLKLNHFIYTTHSHSNDKNKFRAVIEAEVYQQKDLKLNNGLLLTALAELDIKIKFVKEMNTWSQPWFVPTRENPDDELFESYKYTSGNPWVSREESVKTDKVAQVFDASSTETLDKMYENVRTGAEYHESLRNISYQLIMDGMQPAHVKAMLRAMLNGSLEVGTERWQTRFDDVDRLVDGAVNRNATSFSVMSLTDDDVVGLEIALPQAPGRLGQLIQEAFEASRYPDNQIALVSALGVVAGICGRKFNVDFADKTGKTDPTALNLYLTLVGNTGSGKDGIKAFIEKILFNGAGIKPAKSFLGAGEFTSIRALDQQVKDARSQVCIDGEAGISMKNKTGDKAGVRKAILSLYGRGHHNGWSDPKTYSNVDDTIPPRRAIALTRISESTEIELFAAYRDSDAFESGLIPRQSIFRVIKPSVDYNREMRKELSPNLVKKFNDLIDVCSSVQAVEDPVSHFIHCDDEDLIEALYDYADQLKKNSVNQSLDRITQIMSSRMFVKALRYAGIAVVFNKDKVDGNCLVLGWDEWNWARAMVEYELSTIENCFAGYEDTADGAVMKVAMCISQLINGTHKNKDAERVTPEQRKANVIPMSVVQRLLRRDNEIKALAADPTRGNHIQDGVLKCLDYMSKVGTVKLFDKGGIKLIQVMPVFNDLYSI